MEIRSGRPVDENRVAEQPDWCVVGSVELAVRPDSLVLDDYRDVVNAARPGPRDACPPRVVDDEHPGQPSVHVHLALAVRMRVIPQRRGGLVDPPGRRPGGAWLDRLVWPAVGGRRQVRTVPMHRGRLREQVPHVDRDLLSARSSQGWAEVVAVDSPRLGRLAGDELALTGPGGEVEHPTPEASTRGRARGGIRSCCLNATLRTGPGGARSSHPPTVTAAAPSAMRPRTSR